MVEPSRRDSDSGRSPDPDPPQAPAIGSASSEASAADLQATGEFIEPPLPTCTFGSQPPKPLGPSDVVTLPQPEGYELLGEIGRGGMGVVFKARDRHSGEVVALKCVLSASPSSLYRLKQEFRALADVVHPNLVLLHELRADGATLYFTMELLDGVDLLSYARQTEWAEFDRQRDALRQLACGLIALHAAGKLHRDLKPSNVMVTPQGRVVILDFGLAAELDRQGRHPDESGVFLGTAAYAAPEQAAALPLSAASDWYSFGAIVYQLLTGRTPFQGSLLQVLREKQQRDPPAPSLLREGIPEDLDRLCMHLLNRDPAARPGGPEVLRRLQNERSEVAGDGPTLPADQMAVSRASHLPQTQLIGRDSHLHTLMDAYRAMCSGRVTIVLVHGRSGMGKTSLIERFLDDLRESDSAVVLSGRCYESESVPFKALDSLMDRLSEYLAQASGDLVQTLLPNDTASLARVFPVFQRVEAVAQMPARLESGDERELRRRAVRGLRELLNRLGRRPLVLFIDDLQWGDLDSAALLTEVLRPPDPPALLLLGAYRSELAETSPFLQSFLRTKESAALALEMREIEVASLTEAEAQELALSQLTTERPSASEEPGLQARAQAIARESLGNPFFVHELVQHIHVPVSSQEELSTAPFVRLDEVLWARVQRLSEAARRLLEVVAVAGKPLPLALAGEAAGLTAAESQATRTAWATLRSGRLIGSARRAGQDVIEPFHDRIREAVTGHLQRAVLRQHHGRLAQLLESTGQADPEMLAIHFHGAEEPLRAARYYALGGDKAGETLAFDHAARLYGLALGLGDWTVVEAAAWHAKRGDALANAGRGPESAATYLRAAGGVNTSGALELRRRAAFQYCASGHNAEGRRVLVGVLESIGMAMPRNLWQAIISLFWYRFRLWVRGLKFQERDAAQVHERELHRVDVTWAVSAGLSMIEAVTGAAFQPLNLLLALRAGEPHRLARALAWEAALRCGVRGRSGLPRATQFLALARSLADRLEDPYALGMVQLAGGMSEFCIGCWPSARDFLVQAAAFFQRCRAAIWERETTQLFLMRTLLMLGEFAEAERLSGPSLKDARERGDLYSALMNGTYVGANVLLAADDAAGARNLVRELMSEWPTAEFNTQQLHALWGETCIDLYSEEGTAAWDRLNRVWPLTREPQNVQIIHIWMLSFRSRSALAAARTSGPRLLKPLLRVAEADARRLERTKNASSTALAQLIRAGIASSREDDATARLQLAQAAESLDAVAMHSYAAAARWRLGVLLGGQEGRALVERADSWMRSHGIRNPPRMVAMHAPGFRNQPL